ncbi:hypothetical protein GCM10010218_60790 [Streptomyces mashuensis]|uniref:Uncharacterized protein n=1 Tax=Streptomyces mashuensis TaxID=33904 RepID=A0A919EF98_9ACTN|nr:hypothetical protein GCM10010218_60790 [Streptomyces mashuensis]
MLGVAGRAIAWTDDDRALHLEAHLSDLVRLIEDKSEPSLNVLRPTALLMPAAEAVHQEHELGPGPATPPPGPVAPRATVRTSSWASPALKTTPGPAAPSSTRWWASPEAPR